MSLQQRHQRIFESHIKTLSGFIVFDATKSRIFFLKSYFIQFFKHAKKHRLNYTSPAQPKFLHKSLNKIIRLLYFRK